MKNFVHLHVHTDHSFLDGYIKIPDLIARAQNLEMPAIAITDHGNLCGAIKFYNEAKKRHKTYNRLRSIFCKTILAK